MENIEYTEAIILAKTRSPQAILETNVSVMSFITKNKDGVPSVYKPADSYRAQYGFEVLCVPLRSEKEASLFLQHKIPYDIVISMDGTKETTRLFHSEWLCDEREAEWGIEIPIDDSRYKRAVEVSEQTREIVYEASDKESVEQVEKE